MTLVIRYSIGGVTMQTANLSVSNAGLLSVAQHQMVQRLEQYDMSFVFQKLMTDGKLEQSSVPVLEREFKRFMILAGLGICPLAMIGPLVDEVWHQFVLFTKEYREFCLTTIGQFIGHRPDTPATPIPILAGENFREGYKRYFGQLDDIWYEGMNGETKQYYLAPTLVGKPPRSWSGWAEPE